jgi:hypothetical protein
LGKAIWDLAVCLHRAGETILSALFGPSRLIPILFCFFLRIRPTLAVQTAAWLIPGLRAEQQIHIRWAKTSFTFPELYLFNPLFTRLDGRYVLLHR